MATKQIIKPQFNTFTEFYPYYLKEHSNTTCRRLHVFIILSFIAHKILTKIYQIIGSLLALSTLIYFIATGQYYKLPISLVIGYGFAWVKTL